MRYSRYLLAAAVGLACSAADAAPPRAKPKPKPSVEALRDKLGRSVLDRPGVVMPANRQALDAALARRDWPYLGQATREVGSIQNAMLLLNWERYQTYRGGGYNIAYMYASTLATAANSYDKAAAQNPKFAPMARGLRRAALTELLYTYAVLAVDGARCADATAPEAHRDQIASFTEELRQSADRLSVQERLGVIEAALRQEREIAPVRDPDPELCQGGLAELNAALMASSDRTTTAGPQPGYPGTNVTVATDPSRRPVYSDRAQWAPRQVAARVGLRDQLAALLGMSRKP